MKKLIVLLFVLLIFSSTTSYAQHKPFLFGFKIAPNIGWMNPGPESFENEGAEVGFSWGFMSEFFLMENYAITTGFDVVYLNSRLSYPHDTTIIKYTDTTDVTGRLSRKYNLKYIEVPLTLKMKTREMGNFRLFGRIGVGVSFLLTAKGTDRFESDIVDFNEGKKDINDDLKTARGSLILGGGIEYMIGGSTKLIFEIDFDNCFTDVLKDPDGSHDAINNYLDFSIGILF